jgi:hypothetical protein
MNTVLCFASLVALASAHPTYPEGSRLPSEADCRGLAPTVPSVSHHIHLFLGDKPKEPADMIFQIMIEALNIDKECDSWVGHDSRRCAFNMDGNIGGNGPGWYFVPGLPRLNWGISVMPSDLGTAYELISKNRCKIYQNETVCYDIGVHPNTGCWLNDHHEWMAWFGEPNFVFDLGFSPCWYGCGPTTQPGCNDAIGPCEPESSDPGGCCSDAWVRTNETLFGRIFPGVYPDLDCKEDGNVDCPGHPDTWEVIQEAAKNKPDEYGAGFP